MGQGVIVGRFQVPYLSRAHRHLISFVDKSTNSNFIIILGVKLDEVRTIKNPFTYLERVKMIKESCNIKSCYPLLDMPGHDILWSHNLDVLISCIYSGNEYSDLKLYGGRDSFIKQYSGKFPTVEVQNPFQSDSGTKLRDECFAEPIDNKSKRVAFLQGMIYANRSSNVSSTDRAS